MFYGMNKDFIIILDYQHFITFKKPLSQKKLFKNETSKTDPKVEVEMKNNQKISDSCDTKHAWQTSYNSSKAY